MSITSDKTLFAKLLREQSKHIIDLAETNLKDVIDTLKIPQCDEYGNLITRPQLNSEKKD
jgi:hypothetical protein